MRTAARAAAFAVIAYVPVGLAAYAFDVVFPSLRDSTAGVLAGDGYLLVALMGAGALARYTRPGLVAPVLAGVAAGLVFAVLSMATFTVIDNAFLEATALGVAILLAIMGAVLAPLGALLAQEADLAWRRGLSRRLTRRRLTRGR